MGSDMEEALWNYINSGTDRSSDHDSSDTVATAPEESSASDFDDYEAVERLNTVWKKKHCPRRDREAWPAF